MHREMIGRLELFKEKPILVTKIGAAYEVVPGIPQKTNKEYQKKQ
ncbi:hypothetical protein [Fodinisporobacter ferrooxydans]